VLADVILLIERAVAVAVLLAGIVDLDAVH
jgi:hypothetical protein